MAKTRVTFLNSLVSQLKLPGITTATRRISTLDVQESETPYIGVMAGQEINEFTDSTGNKVRKRVNVEIYLVTTQDNTDVELLVDKIRDKIEAPINLGSNVLYTSFDDVDPTIVLAATEDKFATTRINLTVIYFATRGES